MTYLPPALRGHPWPDMSINIRHCANGWIVEVWREKTKREEHVFTDTAEMIAFVQQAAGELG